MAYSISRPRPIGNVQFAPMPIRPIRPAAGGILTRPDPRPPGSPAPAYRTPAWPGLPARRRPAERLDPRVQPITLLAWNNVRSNYIQASPAAAHEPRQPGEQDQGSYETK